MKFLVASQLPLPSVLRNSRAQHAVGPLRHLFGARSGREADVPPSGVGGAESPSPNVAQSAASLSQVLDDLAFTRLISQSCYDQIMPVLGWGSYALSETAEHGGRSFYDTGQYGSLGSDRDPSEIRRDLPVDYSADIFDVFSYIGAHAKAGTMPTDVYPLYDAYNLFGTLPTAYIRTCMPKPLLRQSRTLRRRRLGYLLTAGSYRLYDLPHIWRVRVVSHGTWWFHRLAKENQGRVVRLLLSRKGIDRLREILAHCEGVIMSLLLAFPDWEHWSYKKTDKIMHCMISNCLQLETSFMRQIKDYKKSLRKALLTERPIPAAPRNCRFFEWFRRLYDPNTKFGLTSIALVTQTRGSGSPNADMIPKVIADQIAVYTNEGPEPSFLVGETLYDVFSELKPKDIRQAITSCHETLNTNACLEKSVKAGGKAEAVKLMLLGGPVQEIDLNTGEEKEYYVDPSEIGQYYFTRCLRRYIFSADVPENRYYDVNVNVILEPGYKARLTTSGSVYFAGFLQPYSHICLDLIRHVEEGAAGVAASHHGWQFARRLDPNDPRLDWLFSGIEDEVVGLSTDLTVSTDYIHRDQTVSVLKFLNGYLNIPKWYGEAVIHHLIAPRDMYYLGNKIATKTQGLFMGDPVVKVILTCIQLACAKNVESTLNHPYFVYKENERAELARLKAREYEEDDLRPNAVHVALSYDGWEDPEYGTRDMAEAHIRYHATKRVKKPKKFGFVYAVVGDDFVGIANSTHFLEVFLVTLQRARMKISEKDTYISSKAVWFAEEMILIPQSKYDSISSISKSRLWGRLPYVDFPKIRLLLDVVKHVPNVPFTSDNVGRVHLMGKLMSYMKPNMTSAIMHLASFLQDVNLRLTSWKGFVVAPRRVTGYGKPPLFWNPRNYVLWAIQHRLGNYAAKYFYIIRVCDQALSGRGLIYEGDLSLGIASNFWRKGSDEPWFFRSSNLPVDTYEKLRPHEIARLGKYDDLLPSIFSRLQKYVITESEVFGKYLSNLYLESLVRDEVEYHEEEYSFDDIEPAANRLDKFMSWMDLSRVVSHWETDDLMFKNLKREKVYLREEVEKIIKNDHILRVDLGIDYPDSGEERPPLTEDREAFRLYEWLKGAQAAFNRFEPIPSIPTEILEDDPILIADSDTWSQTIYHAVVTDDMRMCRMIKERHPALRILRIPALKWVMSDFSQNRWAYIFPDISCPVHGAPRTVDPFTACQYKPSDYGDYPNCGGPSLDERFHIDMGSVEAAMERNWSVPVGVVDTMPYMYWFEASAMPGSTDSYRFGEYQTNDLLVKLPHYRKGSWWVEVRRGPYGV